MSGRPLHRRLRTALLLRLLLPLVLIVVAAAALGGYAAHRLADRMFDRSLIDTARALAAHVRLDGAQPRVTLPAATLGLLLRQGRARAWFSLRRHGVSLHGEAALPDDGDDESRYPDGRAFDAVVQGEELRVAAVPADPPGAGLTVLVAEPMDQRSAAERDLLLMLLPTVVLLLAAAATVHIAVQRTLGPLEDMAARWEAHSNTSLEPIGVQGVPRELLPFAAALNGLLARTRALVQQERQFCENAAHQLRTPLAALELGLSRAQQAPDLPRTREVLGELRHATRRTSRLIQQLLSLARLDAQAAMPASVEPLDLAALVREVGERHVSLAAAKDIRFELRAPAHPVIAAGHAALLGEAVANLLDNALRYTPRGGRVVIDLQDEPPTVRVSDSGPGIPEAERETVFERFARGTRQAATEGSGLGLAIARDVARLHGGEVSLQEAAGGGTVATLRLRSSTPADESQSREDNRPQESGQ